MKRKRTEEALRKSEEKFRTLFNGINDAVFLLLDEPGVLLGHFVEVNNTACQMLQYTREELMSMSPLDIVSEEVKADYLQLTKALREQSRMKYERVYVRKDGTTFPVELNTHLFDSMGQKMVLTVARDITERKRMEDALHQSEEELRSQLDEIIHAQQERAKSEENFRILVDNAPDAIFIQTNNRFRYLNNATLQILGATSADQLLGTDFLDRIDPSIHERIRERAKGLIEDQKPAELLEEIYLKLDGTRVYVEAKAVTFQYQGESGALVMLRDITDRKRAETDLIESEERYRTIVESAFDGIVIHQDGVIIYINQTGARLLGSQNPDIFIGKPALDIAAPEFRAWVAERVHRAPEHPQDLIHEKFLRRDGTTFDADVTTTPITWKGRPAAYATFRDITERKRMEDALRQSEEELRSQLDEILRAQQERAKSEERYRILFDESAISLWEEDFSDMKYWIDTKRSEGIRDFRAWFETHPEDVKSCTRMVNVTRINRATLQLFKAQSIQDFSDGLSSIFIPESYDAFREVTLALVSGKTGFECEMSVQTLTGEKRVVLLKMNVVPDIEPALAVISLLDITERKQAEEALQQVNRKLTMLNSITRHDILNQLMGLLVYLELSKENVTDPVFLEYIRKEEQAAMAIQLQIEFTRDYQDIGAQAPKWQMLSDTINSAIRQLDPPGIDIKTDVADVEFFADPLIEKVFYNLMENSLRHGDHVTHLDYSIRETEGNLILTYRDDGVGITAEDKKKLFWKGFGKHTGLGLFLSREILSITGITITENGEPGTGVRFEITVPKGAYRFLKYTTWECHD